MSINKSVNIFVLLLWLVGEVVLISHPSGFYFGPNKQILTTHTPCLEIEHRTNFIKHLEAGFSFFLPFMIGWWRCADIWSKWFSIWIKFVQPTIIKNVRIVNMCFWEIIPSSFVFIKDYEGYDEVSKLAMYWSSQLPEVSKIFSIAKSLYDPTLKVFLLVKSCLLLTLIKCLIGHKSLGSLFDCVL